MRWINILSIKTPSCEGRLWNLLNGLYILTYTPCDNNRRYVLMCNFKNKKHLPHAGILISSRKKCKRNVLSWSRALISSDTVSIHFFGGYRNAEILLILRHPLVRFRPHILMHKYHVLSMKYFLDVTLFITKEKTGFFKVTYIPSIIVLTQPEKRRTALTATQRSSWGGGDSSHERSGDARRKFWIKPLKESNLGVAQAFFDP